MPEDILEEIGYLIRLIKEKQRRQYEGHNTPAIMLTEAHMAAVNIMAKGSFVA